MAMYFQLLLFVIQCIMFGENVQFVEQVSLTLKHPLKYDVIYSDTIQMHFLVDILREELSDSHTYLCISSESTDSVDNTSMIDSARQFDVCNNSLCQLSVSGFRTGTHRLIAYLKTIVDDKQYIVAVVNDILFNVVSPLDISTPLLHQEDDSDYYNNMLDIVTVNHIINTTHTYSENKISLNVSTFQSIPLTKVIGSFGPQAMRNRIQPWFRPINIVIYLKEIKRHGANNRLLQWLFDHSTFIAHNYNLTVVTSSDDPENMVLYNQLIHDAKVNVLQYDCLSIFKRITSMNNTTTIKHSMITLSAYLHSNSVDAVIALNTYGDPLTNTFLYCAYHDFSVLSLSEFDLTVNRDGNINMELPQLFLQKKFQNRPYIFIELANLELSAGWLEMNYHDGLIAPSRYVGRHHLTASQGKLTAVIYPVAISYKWLQKSPCMGQYLDSDHEQDQRPLSRRVSATVFTVVDPQNYKNDLNSKEAAHSTDHDSIDRTAMTHNDDIDRYVYIYMGRLATEKCPGLLLLAVSYILRAVDNSTIATDLAVSAEEVRAFETLAVFNMYGNGPLKSTLEIFAKDLHIEHLVHFKGHLNESEVEHMMMHSNMLVNPKVHGETFGFIHTEAAAVGLPIIAYKVAAHIESVAGGILVDYIEGKAVEQLAYGIIYAFIHRKEIFSGDNVCMQSKSRIAQWNTRRHSHSLMDVVNIALKDKCR